MSEEEAKTKWCPFVRFHVFAPLENMDGSTVQMARTNRDGDDASTLCIASARMAWRTLAQDQITASTSGMSSFAQRLIIGGYCGLAGSPD